MSQRCPFCDAIIQKNAACCSQCGKPVEKAAGKKKRVMLFLLGLADLGLLVWILQSYLSTK